MKRLLLAVFLLPLMAGGSAVPLEADMPAISVLSPADGSTIYATTWPFTANLTFTLHHDELDDLNALDVKVDGTSILPGQNAIGNPFDSAGCKAAQWPSPLTCNIVATNTALITVPWTVALGPHTISFTVKHTGQYVEEEDVEVTVVLVSAEYPAPPAIANAYINPPKHAASPRRLRTAD
jgi:hypothetical protein